MACAKAAERRTASRRPSAPAGPARTPSRSRLAGSPAERLRRPGCPADQLVPGRTSRAREAVAGNRPGLPYAHQLENCRSPTDLPPASRSRSRVSLAFCSARHAASLTASTPPDLVRCAHSNNCHAPPPHKLSHPHYPTHPPPGRLFSSCTPAPQVHTTTHTTPPRARRSYAKPYARQSLTRSPAASSIRGGQPARTGSSAASLTSVSASSSAGSDPPTTPTPA